MIGEQQPIAVKVITDEGTVNSARAVSLGLIVTELVINAGQICLPHRQDRRSYLRYL